MRTKTERIYMAVTPEEKAAFRELARLKRRNVSAAAIDAVYDALKNARQDAALTASWEKAQAQQ